MFHSNLGGLIEPPEPPLHPAAPAFERLIANENVDTALLPPPQASLLGRARRTFHYGIDSARCSLRFRLLVRGSLGVVDCFEHEGDPSLTTYPRAPCFPLTALTENKTKQGALHCK